MIALAKAKPGTLNFGSSGPGSNYHMAAELLKNLTGIDIVHVPYKGSTGMRTDILSGNIQILFDSVPTMAPLIEAGKVRALGTTGRTRSPILPNVPAIAEAGCRALPPRSGSASWRRRPRRSRSSISSTAKSRKFCRATDIQAAWEKQGAVPLDHDASAVHGVHGRPRSPHGRKSSRTTISR